MNLKHSSSLNAITFFKTNSFPRRQRLGAGATFRLILVSCAVLSLMAAPLRQSSADKPTASPLVTDKANLPLSNQFGVTNQIGLTGAGDVFFNPTQTAFFRWDSSSGTRTRVLQAGDPYPGFPGSVTDLVANPFQVNSVGHAATVNFFAQKGARIPRGVFVYDGTSFQKVAMRGDVAPGTGGQLFLNFSPLRINDADQVAFVASFEPPGLGTAGIFLGSTAGPPAKIAVIGETAPGTGGGTYAGFQLIGLNNAGQVAFFSNIAGGSASRAVFIGSTSGVSKVVAQGDPAPGTTGTFNLVTLNPFNYDLNVSGDVAFAAAVIGGAPANQGIWIGNSTSAPAKLMVNTDPTATSLGGTFGGAVFLHGFDNAGKALFRSNPVGATSNHALFQKDLTNPADVVFARNQAAPGGTTEVFFNTLQATVNNSGDVAFLAALQGGTFQFGWFLKESATPTVKIAFQGDSTPAGGTFGLAGANQPAEINSNGQVAFFADILGPNAIGVFLYTPGSGIASVVNSNDSLPAGANPVIRTFMPAASDDLLLFYAFKAGGRTATFTKTLHSGGGQIKRIFGEGDTAPVIGGAFWGVLANFGLINDSEEVAFATNRVVGASAYPASIVFTHKPGVGLQKVAATGDTAPGAAGGTFSAFDAFTFFTPPARINSSGQVVFFANIAGSASNSSPSGIFIGSASGGIQRVARIGETSPVGGTFLNIQSTLSLNDAGQVAFRAVSQVSPPVQTPALFVGTATAAPVKVVALGDAGPGGSTVDLIPTRFQINNAGQVAYVAGLTGGSSPEGVFLGTAGGAQMTVALVGDPAPGTGGGAFSGFREPDVELNNPGDVAFWSEITAAFATSGHFLGSAMAAPAARLIEGQGLPGGGAAGFVSPGINNFIGEQFSLTDAGEMSIFLINITGAPNLGRYVIASATGALREFATTGDKAQGTGSSFGGLFQSVATNSTGRFFFMALLVDGPAKYGVFWDK